MTRAVARTRRPGRPAKGALARVAEYGLVLFFLGLCRSLPAAWIYGLSRPVSRVAFALLARRRRLAIANVEAALGRGHDAHAIARESFRSFGLAVMPEIIKLFPVLTAERADERILARSPELAGLFGRMREIHEGSGGCIFVTPHLGNWEMLPFIAAAFGVPLAVVARPLENPLIERVLTGGRQSAGQLSVAKGNSLPRLRRLLAAGRSVAMLPDQATRNGVVVEFFGRPAPTSPVPALLAIDRGRPIVPCACVRTGEMRFDGYLGEPIHPRADGDRDEEVVRLTRAMTAAFEGIIRAHPGQYLWMHDRWKSYG